jgi:Family of unknown function (DUF6084)
MAATGPSAVAAGSIPELAFAVVDAGRVELTAVPTLRFVVRVDSVGGRQIRSVLLDTQIRIATRRRAYGPSVHDRLFELVGPPADWGTNLQSLLWARTTTVVPPFDDSARIELQIACSYDLEVAAARYLDALGDGDVPLEFLFSGTVFYATDAGLLQTVRIPWDREAAFRMPVSVWRETMDAHFPDSAWLRVDKARYDRLAAFRSRRALPTWEHVVDALLDEERARE